MKMIIFLHYKIAYYLSLIIFTIKHLFILVFKMETKQGRLFMIELILKSFKNEN